MRLHRSNLVWSPRTLRAALQLDGHHGKLCSSRLPSYVRMDLPTLQRTVWRMAPQVPRRPLAALFARRLHFRHDSAVESLLDRPFWTFVGRVPSDVGAHRPDDAEGEQCRSFDGAVASPTEPIMTPINPCVPIASVTVTTSWCPTQLTTELSAF